MADFTAKYRVKAGQLLLIILTGYAIVSLLVQSIRIYTTDLPEKDPVTIHEARIAQPKGSLPASGEIGYVTTVENEKIFATSFLAFKCAENRIRTSKDETQTREKN